jgi:hypothetical protein
MIEDTEICFFYVVNFVGCNNLNNNNCYNNQPRSFPLNITSTIKQQKTIPNQYCTINSNPQKSNPSRYLTQLNFINAKNV